MTLPKWLVFAAAPFTALGAVTAAMFVGWITGRWHG